jgi:hypothetical protein
MYTADPVVNISVFVSGGTPTFSDANYDYRYYRMIVAGAQSALVNLTLNGATANFAGTVTIDAPIYSLVVNSGAGVMLFGTKSAKAIFGQFGSSSEGLT